MEKKKIYVQAEAENSLVKGDRLFFISSNVSFEIGQGVEFSNKSGTMTTEGYITQRARDFYEAKIETDPVENRLDITHIKKIN